MEQDAPLMPDTKPKPPTLKAAWASLQTVGTWLRAHLSAVCLALAAIATGAATAIHFAAPVYRAVTVPNAIRDSKIAENAKGLENLTTQVNTWHDERVRGEAASNTSLKETGEKVSRLATAVEVTNAKVEALTKTQDETNRRLDMIIPLLSRQARASRDPFGGYVTAPSIGPPAPGRDQ
jgi:hypothetical protein